MTLGEMRTCNPPLLLLLSALSIFKNIIYLDSGLLCPPLPCIRVLHVRYSWACGNSSSIPQLTSEVRFYSGRQILFIPVTFCSPFPGTSFCLWALLSRELMPPRVLLSKSIAVGTQFGLFFSGWNNSIKSLRGSSVGLSFSFLQQ